MRDLLTTFQWCIYVLVSGAASIWEKIVLRFICFISTMKMGGGQRQHKILIHFVFLLIAQQFWKWDLQIPKKIPKNQGTNSLWKHCNFPSECIFLTPLHIPNISHFTIFISHFKLFSSQIKRMNRSMVLWEFFLFSKT